MRYWEGASDCPKWEKLLTQQTGRICYDIGANGGTYTRIFARNFEHVLAWEPCQESFEALIDNRPPNVAAYNTAISDHEGFVTLREAAYSILSGQLVTGDSHPWGDTIGWREIPCTTLDAVTTIHWLPDLVKVDVEASELQVIAGAKVLIATRHARWMIEVHQADFEEPIRQAFDGYSIRKQLHSGYAENHPYRHEHFYLDIRPGG